MQASALAIAGISLMAMSFFISSHMLGGVPVSYTLCSRMHAPASQTPVAPPSPSAQEMRCFTTPSHCKKGGEGGCGSLQGVQPYQDGAQQGVQHGRAVAVAGGPHQVEGIAQAAWRPVIGTQFQPLQIICTHERLNQHHGSPFSKLLHTQ